MEGRKEYEERGLEWTAMNFKKVGPMKMGKPKKAKMFWGFLHIQ
jgi:hypothetical protein